MGSDLLRSAFYGVRFWVRVRLMDDAISQVYDWVIPEKYTLNIIFLSSTKMSLSSILLTLLENLGLQNFQKRFGLTQSRLNLSISSGQLLLLAIFLRRDRFIMDCLNALVICYGVLCYK